MTQLQDLEHRVMRFMQDRTNGDFANLLSQIIAYQTRWTEHLGKYWHGHDVRHPLDVPAVPSDVFRHLKLATTEVPTPYTFRTSGTTDGRRGEHHHASVNAYNYGALRHFQHIVVPDRDEIDFINLVFDPAQIPDSSLSHMVGVLADHCDPNTKQAYHLTTDGLDCQTAAQALQSATSPTLVFATAFALVELFDTWTGSTILPPGSRVVETGGFKGKTRVVSKTELYQSITDRLGVPADRIVSEYGMTELSSQLWTGNIRAAHANDVAADLLIPPHWCRVNAVDPETLRPLASGETGLLRFIDLANVDSVVAVQTSDLGRVTDHGLELFGRAPGATPRGCSLAIEEILASAK